MVVRSFGGVGDRRGRPSRETEGDRFERFQQGRGSVLDVGGEVVGIVYFDRRRPYHRVVANTSYLRREVEGYVRGLLSEEFGQSFTSEFLALRPGGRHEFDAVSGDGSVVASVKSASGLTSGGKIPSGKIKDCVAELYYLSLVDAPIRRLVLTTPAFFDIFERVTVGAIADGLEVVCMPLPPEIQREVDLIVQEASREVTPAAAAVAVVSEVDSDT